MPRETRTPEEDDDELTPAEYERIDRLLEQAQKDREAGIPTIPHAEVMARNGLPRR